MIFKKYCVTHGGNPIRTFWRRKSAIRYRDWINYPGFYVRAYAFSRHGRTQKWVDLGNTKGTKKQL